MFLCISNSALDLCVDQLEMPIKTCVSLFPFLRKTHSLTKQGRRLKSSICTNKPPTFGCVGFLIPKHFCPNTVYVCWNLIRLHFYTFFVILAKSYVIFFLVFGIHWSVDVWRELGEAMSSSGLNGLNWWIPWLTYLVELPIMEKPASCATFQKCSVIYRYYVLLIFVFKEYLYQNIGYWPSVIACFPKYFLIYFIFKKWIFAYCGV